MKKIFYSLTILIGSLLFVPNVLAAEIQVCTDGCAHNSLVSAIAAANDGDEIIVSGNVIQFAGEETDDIVTTAKKLTISGAASGAEINMTADNKLVVAAGGSLFIENLSITCASTEAITVENASLTMQNVSMSVKGSAISITNETSVASQLSLTEVYIEYVGGAITQSVFGVEAYGNVKLDLIDLEITDFYKNQAELGEDIYVAAIGLVAAGGFSPQLSLSTSNKANDEGYFEFYNPANGKFGADVSNLANNILSLATYGENIAANINIEGTIMGTVYLSGTSKMVANYNIWQDANNPINQTTVDNNGPAIAGLSLDAAKEMIATDNSASYTLETLFAVYGPAEDERSFLYWLCHNETDSPHTAPENFVYLVGALALASILYSAYISKKAKLLN